MKKRVFVAINLSADVQATVAEVIAQVKKKNSFPSLHWVKPASLHFTVHFLGLMDAAQIEAVEKILVETTRRFAGGNIRLDQLDAFPGLHHPRVVVIGAKQTDGDSLQKLQQTLAEPFQRLGIIIDQRAWTLHLTIARVSGPCHLDLDGFRLPKIDLPVQSIELMESNLAPSGAEYQIIKSLILKKNPD